MKKSKFFLVVGLLFCSIVAMSIVSAMEIGWNTKLEEPEEKEIARFLRTHVDAGDLTDLDSLVKDKSLIVSYDFSKNLFYICKELRAPCFECSVKKIQCVRCYAVVLFQEGEKHPLKDWLNVRVSMNLIEPTG